MREDFEESELGPTLFGVSLGLLFLISCILCPWDLSRSSEVRKSPCSRIMLCLVLVSFSTFMVCMISFVEPYEIAFIAGTMASTVLGLMIAIELCKMKLTAMKPLAGGFPFALVPVAVYYVHD